MSKLITFNSAPKLIQMPNKRSRVMLLASSMDCTIGKDNSIPWKCSTDLKFVRLSTTGNIVIMGRTTYESIGSKPLPNRVNIVVSSRLKSTDVPDGVYVTDTLTEAFKIADSVDLSSYTRNTLNEHIFILGGVMLYEAALECTDEVIWSTIDVMCGAHGYGSEFIVNKLLPKITNQERVSCSLMYFNDNIPNLKDINHLREINHYHDAHSPNKFSFK